MKTETAPNRLRLVREQRGERLEDLAWIIKERTGHSLDPTTLGRIERGHSNSGLETLAAIARALRCDPSWLWSPPGVDEEPTSAEVAGSPSRVVVQAPNTARS